MKNKLCAFLITFAVSALTASLLLINLNKKNADSSVNNLPKARDGVVILAIDDNSIEKIGAFPWTRDVFADCALELKLLGAQSVVFDLNYTEAPPTAFEKYLSPQTELLPPSSKIESFKNYSFYDIYKATLLENDFFDCAYKIFYSGFFKIPKHADDFEDAHLTFEAIKNLRNSLRNSSAQDSTEEMDVNFETLNDLEEEFYEQIKFFVSAECEQEVLSRIKSSRANASRAAEIQELIEQSRKLYEETLSAKEDARKKVQNATCVIGYSFPTTFGNASLANNISGKNASTKISVPLTILLVLLLCAALGFAVMFALCFCSSSRKSDLQYSKFSPEAINQIKKDPSILNGESREITAVFTSIKDFSVLSENLTPNTLVDLLNAYLTRMSDIILKHGGTIGKCEGDSIAAFFGAPLSMPDNAQKACRAALELKTVEAKLNEELLVQNKIESPLFTRIGINSGKMLAGNMGTSTCINYNIMGNEANLAARLEGVNKYYSTGGILISEQTKNMLGNEFIIRELDRVRIAGIDAPVKLFELLECNAEPDEQTQDYLQKWAHALELFNNREYEKSGKEFTKLHSAKKDDGPTLFYIQKCKGFTLKPPPKKWDGVFNLSKN